MCIHDRSLTLDYFVWSAPVILDPNTAHPELKLSDDLTGLTWSPDTHSCPSNPERFDVYPCVLGSEGFISGTHCWDVEVGDNTHWTVGITTASNPRKGFTFFGKDVWCVWYKKKEYFSYYQDQAYTPISVKETLQRVRVLLDWDRGEVCFSDPVTDTHLCSFTTVFTERLFPFFSSVCVTCSLRILPDKICVTDKHIYMWFCIFHVVNDVRIFISWDFYRQNCLFAYYKWMQTFCLW